jgi:hypothetical protein
MAVPLPLRLLLLLLPPLPTDQRTTFLPLFFYLGAN